MKLKSLLLAFSLIIAGYASSAQKDPKATKILKQVTANSNAKKTISMDFTYSVKSGKVNQSNKGTVLIKGNKYKYTLFGVTKISDGKSICTIDTSAQELVITNANYNDADEFSPKEMFKIYEKGYKYRYIKEIKSGTKTLHVIDLYPDTGNKAAYRKVTLYINKVTYEITKIELNHKTTSKVYTVTVDKATYDKAVADSTFTCACSIKPKYDCDDQRNAK